jgi:phosphomannomutase/phosphoglucomutase
MGAAYDGDGDRVAFVDETGQPVPNDKIIVLFARYALRDGPSPIVYDQKCSRLVPDTIRSLGGRPVMELSGHTFIKRAFMTQNAAYAGELSGHHFFHALGGDDGLAASLLLAGVVRESGQALSALAAEIQAYPITPDLRLPMDPAGVQEVLAGLERGLGGEARLTKTDGLRLELEDGWGLVRPSVTEPLITLRFEGVDQAALRRLLEKVEAAAPRLRGRLTSTLDDQ